MRLPLLLLLCVQATQAQCPNNAPTCPDGNCPTGPPPNGCSTTGGGGAGAGGTTDTTSTECTISSGTCSLTGSSNNIYRHLTYNSTTGKFNGTVVTNGCPDHVFQNQNTASCISVTIPNPSYANGPSAAPLLGRVGLVLSGGTNIYGPFEAGFAAGFACVSENGDCAAGLDVATCEAELKYECPSGIKTELFMDSCGGHASPYHHHTDPVCKYNSTNMAVHSPLIGVALDGYGIYGVWEGGNARPCVDSCHGHTAQTPGSDSFGLTTASVVYHYHTYDTTAYPAVWTIGCYGPVASVAACKSLFSSCGDDTTTVYTTDYPDGVTVDLFCPCYDPPPCGVDAPAATFAPAPSTLSRTISASPSISASIVHTVSPTNSPTFSSSPVSSSSMVGTSKTVLVAIVLAVLLLVV